MNKIFSSVLARAAATGVAASLLLAGGIVVGQASSAPTPVANVAVTNAPAPPVTKASAPLRCTSGVWSAVDDAGHDPYGIGAISANATYVRVYTTAMTKVGTSSVTVDETYVNNNVTVGASVGLDYTDLYFAKNGTPVDPRTICYAWSNVWFLVQGY